MSKQVVPIDQVILQTMPQFQRIAEKRQLVRWEEESQYALQACKANPRLLDCNVSTIQDAVINVASVGLSLNPAAGYAYLVPEYSTAAGGSACQLRISFKGLIKLATDTGAISWVKAEVVKEEDFFEYRGPCVMPIHTMNPFAPRGNTVGAYCIAKLKDSDEFLVDVIAEAELQKIKSCAKTTKVWDMWPDEMDKKAIIKRASKQWPKTKDTERLNEAIQIINEAEGSDFDGMAKLDAIANQILTHIKNDDADGIGEIWGECTQEEQYQLWTAITKGGWFTQADKVTIRSADAEYKRKNAETEDVPESVE